MEHQPHIWVLKGQHTGDNNNRRAVAAAISPDNWEFVDFYRCHQLQEELVRAGVTGRCFIPDIFIVGEEDSSEPSWYLKKALGDQTFIVGLQVPDIDCNDFESGIGSCFDYRTDLQLLFRHHASAYLSEESPSAYIHLDDCPTYITGKLLEESVAAAPEDLKLFAREGSPLVFVALGSVLSETHFALDHKALIEKNVRDLAGCVAGATRKMDGKIMISTSRRTKPFMIEAFRQALGDMPLYFYDWQQRGVEDNPYMSMLAMADRIVVTGDSISMVSDALASGKPTFVYVPSDYGASSLRSLLKHSLRNNDLLRDEVRLYMQRLAEEDKILPMRFLATKQLKSIEPLNSAALIARQVVGAYEDFCSRRDVAAQKDCNPAFDYA